MSATKKTDNDFLRDKLDLRVAHLPPDPVTVLDCFSGKGVIWRGVQRLTGRKIRSLPIDVRNDLTAFHLDGRNQEFLIDRRGRQPTLWVLTDAGKQRKEK